MYAELGILFKLLIMCLKFILLVLARLIRRSSLVRGICRRRMLRVMMFGLYPIATMYQVGSSSGLSNVLCVLPPSTKRPPDHPKTLRIPSMGEIKKRQMRCGRCGVLGFHNKTSCVAPVVFK